MALKMNIYKLIIHEDSQIVHGHIMEMFEAKENMKNYSKITKTLISQFKCTDFEEVSRRNNRKLMSYQRPHPGNISPGYG